MTQKYLGQLKVRRYVLGIESRRFVPKRLLAGSFCSSYRLTRQLRFYLAVDRGRGGDDANPGIGEFRETESG